MCTTTCQTQISDKEGGSERGEMWKQDLKKIAMLTVGAGGTLALYKYNSRKEQLT